jgi:hypothetical protein
MLNLYKMKGTLGVAFFALFQSNAFAQTQIGSAPIWYTTGNYVGVGGATSPAAPLHVYNGANTVNGSNQVVALFQNSNYNSSNTSGEARMVLGWANHYAAGISAMKETNNTDGLRFYTEYGYNTPRQVMSISAWGNIQVGLPNANNTQTMSFPGNYNFESMNLGQSGNGNSFMEFLNHDGTSLSYGMKMGTNVDVYGQGFYLATAAPASSYSALSYNTTAAIFVNASNQVGINTNNPQGYTLAVNGPAIFTQATVKLHSNWPDYVFDKNYQPVTLDSLRQFLVSYRHLPDMPAAADVEKDGIDLGEMNKRLLKKVEELTLYALDAHEEIVELRRRLDAQEKELTALKKQ